MSTDNKRLIQLCHSINNEFKEWFLPLKTPQDKIDQLLEINPELRVWVGRNGYGLISAASPPPLSKDPKARPDRLGMVNGRLKVLRKLSLSDKIDLSYRVLDRMLDATDDVAVAFSGGRDSLIALHLTLQRRQNIKVVFVNTSIEFPETITYVRQLAQDWSLDFHEVRVKKNFWQLTDERGLPIGGRGNGTFLSELSEAAGVKLSNACCNQLKITPARQFYRKMEIEAQVTGLRVDESMMRRFNFADYGALRWSRDYGTLVAWPIFVWNTEDIETYIERYRLPVNPLYEMGHQRVGCWSCMQDFFKTDSRLFTLRQTHPGMYETLKKKYGEEMLEVLKVWGNVQDHDFTLEHFDGLYTPCGLELLSGKL